MKVVTKRVYEFTTGDVIAKESGMFIAFIRVHGMGDKAWQGTGSTPSISDAMAQEYLETGTYVFLGNANLGQGIISL